MKKVTTRIYIENTQTFKTVVITSLMSALDVVKDITDRSNLDPGGEWTLFELVNEIGIGTSWYH